MRKEVSEVLKRRAGIKSNECLISVQVRPHPGLSSQPFHGRRDWNQLGRGWIWVLYEFPRKKCNQ